LRHQDFRKTISSVAEEAFIYADPPYFTTSQRVFVEYGSKSFGKEDLRDLIKELILATRRGAAIVLSYHHSLIADALPSTWRKTAVQVTRNVGGFSGSRKVETEMLWTNLPIESVT